MKYFFTLLITILLFSCNNDKEEIATEKSNSIVKFMDREIDLEPYFTGFPYKSITPVYKGEKILYMEIDSTISLKETTLSKNPDLTIGKTISDIDFATRNVWGLKYNEKDKLIYWSGDERNDEIINLFALNPETKDLTKLTDVPYIFGWTFNKDKNKIAYVPRLGHIENRSGEIRILDLNDKSEKTIYTDEADMRLTWSSPSWSKDEKWLVTSAFKDADRTYCNLVLINTEDGSMRVLTDPSKKRSYPVYAHSDWTSETSFIYFNNEDGFSNLWHFDFESNENRQLTSFTTDISNFEILEIGGEKKIICTTSNPIKTKFYILDMDGNILKEEDYNGNINFIDSKENFIMCSSNSATNRYSLEELTITDDLRVLSEKYLEEPEELRKQIVNAKVEKHDYPTFDIDPKTGEQRMIHSYLFVPNNPLPKEDAIVIIQSFYGGSNNYSNRAHIFADAGIYFFSPAPRGSSGFGQEFYSMNDKDLGGNEIIDIIYAAKYISEKLDIPAGRIGIWGRSHGGYASMRLMTFPGEINGNKADFNFGFGMADAGFSDIIHFYENCNIPDWVTLEAGDPATERDKILDRSPLYHADKLKGPILLTHGTNDSRVPKEGSIWFADSLNKYNKPYTLELFEGEGHSVKGLEGFMKLYKVRFDFLEGLNEK